MHGSNRLGGNSLSDLLVFGRRAGRGAVGYVDALGAERPAAEQADVDAAAERALRPFAPIVADADPATEAPRRTRTRCTPSCSRR